MQTLSCPSLIKNARSYNSGLLYYFTKLPFPIREFFVCLSPPALACIWITIQQELCVALHTDIKRLNGKYFIHSAKSSVILG